MKYIGEHQSIGIPRIASGGVLAPAQPDLEASTAYVQITTPPGEGDGPQDTGNPVQDFLHQDVAHFPEKEEVCLQKEIVDETSLPERSNAPESQEFGAIPEFLEGITLPTSDEIVAMLSGAEVPLKSAGDTDITGGIESLSCTVETPIGKMHALRIALHAHST